MSYLRAGGVGSRAGGPAQEAGRMLANLPLLSRSPRAAPSGSVLAAPPDTALATAPEVPVSVSLALPGCLVLVAMGAP